MSLWLFWELQKQSTLRRSKNCKKNSTLTFSLWSYISIFGCLPFWEAKNIWQLLTIYMDLFFIYIKLSYILWQLHITYRISTVFQRGHFCCFCYFLALQSLSPFSHYCHSFHQLYTPKNDFFLKMYAIL